MESDKIRITLEGAQEVSQARSHLLRGTPMVVAGGALIATADGVALPVVYLGDTRSQGELRRVAALLRPQLDNLSGEAVRRAWSMAGRPSSAWKLCRLDVVVAVEAGAPCAFALLFRLPKTLDAVRALASGRSPLLIAERPPLRGAGATVGVRLALPWLPDVGAAALIASYGG